jgi:hypothetical protein
MDEFLRGEWATPKMGIAIHLHNWQNTAAIHHMG